MLERRMADREWAAGEGFSMADCAAMPPLFYLRAIHSYGEFPTLSAYFERLAARASAQQVIAEARPWFQYFPFAEGLEARFARA